MRTDLPQVYGAVQACHAAIGGGQFLFPQDIHPHLVLCKSISEQDLLKVAARLESEGVRHYLFIEPDIDNQATALITEPITGERRRLFRRYQCVKES